MHYVLSDIHGCYKQYKEMMKKIEFSREDELYIIGDVLDRGPNPIAVFENMISNKNIFPIMGNHESMALSTLKEMIHNDDVVTLDSILWSSQHNESSLENFRKLYPKNRERIVNYIESFPMYMELEVNGVSYVLSHAGIDYDVFDEKKPLADYNWKDMVWAEIDYDKVYYKDKIMVTGHTPTGIIDKDFIGKIIRKNNHLAIDCGCAYGGRLGCVCLETGAEFYVMGERTY